MTFAEIDAYTEGQRELAQVMWTSTRWLGWISTMIHVGKKAPASPQALMSFPWDEGTAPENIAELIAETAEEREAARLLAEAAYAPIREAKRLARLRKS